MKIQGKPPVDPSSSIGAPAASESKPVERSFASHVEGAERKATEAVIGPTATNGAGPLERLRRGELDLDGYADAKVDEATRHLPSLPPAELQALREMLRDKLMRDPELVALVERATGTPVADPE